MAGTDDNKPSENGHVESNMEEGIDEDNDENVCEEYDVLDSKLDELNQALDLLEQKNDDIHKRLKDLLQSNRDIRKELKHEVVVTEQDK
ncbi:bublin coiled-coil protein [Danaus plexippus]|uniref:Uncharacterized protein n=1 Tax=Danaus plexippus plexippus TaxID=278856 RepID=A0A212ETY2_DANPL|nr:bublin coiled-coil protein [Danaus plexippus]XP_032510513.1 bublin coiled-coil protein [Danaus plexippus]XP_032510514.1 bublin coiled-coil protein [Danaus plexippus]OWR44911.1 hypothetical protein KGM_214174 [Danaus plexippus plexippus]